LREGIDPVEMSEKPEVKKLREELKDTQLSLAVEKENSEKLEAKIKEMEPILIVAKQAAKAKNSTLSVEHFPGRTNDFMACGIYFRMQEVEGKKQFKITEK
jgi:hypothetical protein